MRPKFSESEIATALLEDEDVIIAIEHVRWAVKHGQKFAGIIKSVGGFDPPTFNGAVEAIA